MLRDMFFTLAGWLMFFLGVALATSVKGLFNRLRGGVTSGG